MVKIIIFYIIKDNISYNKIIINIINSISIIIGIGIVLGKLLVFVFPIVLE